MLLWLLHIWVINNFWRLGKYWLAYVFISHHLWKQKLFCILLSMICIEIMYQGKSECKFMAIVLSLYEWLSVLFLSQG